MKKQTVMWLAGGLVLTVVVLVPILKAEDPDAGLSDLEIRSGTVAVDGGSIFYETAGRGETVILIHDGLIHREIWDAQLPIFTKYFRVIRYDRRGYGRSPAATKRFSHVDDLERLLAQLEVDSAVLIGMSAGGRLAVDFSLANPEKVHALVLVGAVVSGFGYTDHFMSRGGHLTPEINADDTKALRYWAFDDPYEIAVVNAEAHERAYELLTVNPQNLDRTSHRLAQRPAKPALPSLDEIETPTMIMVGEYDIPDVHAHAGALEAGIRGSRRIVLRDAGHLVPLEQPQLFNDEVLRFLRGREFHAALDSGEINRAGEIFERLRAGDPELILFTEVEMNQLGYAALADGRVAEAIVLFELNVLAYPDSWNVHDSLGEGLMAAGKNDAALQSFRRSLELNPDNANGTRMIYEIEHGKDPLPDVSGPYLGQEPPGSDPQVFLSGMISTPYREHSSCTFSADGLTVFFTRQVRGEHSIFTSHGHNGAWPTPQPVAFSSPTLDDGAAFFPGEKRLYFGSRRPRGPDDPPNQDTDIWVVELEAESWGEPRLVGPPISTDFNESFPAFKDDGSMYFHSDRPGGHGAMDLYVTREIDGSFAPPENLGPPVNTDASEAAPHVAPDGSYLLFPRFTPESRRLMLSFAERGGNWTEPVDLTSRLELSGTDLIMAKVSPDGRYLFVLDNGDISWVDAEVIEEFRPTSD